MTIPIVTSPNEAVDQPVVAIDGDLFETMPLTTLAAEERGERCVGVIAHHLGDVAFWQNLADCIDMDDLQALDQLSTRECDLVIVGPTALLGNAVETVTRRILEILPGVRVVCATGIRTDIATG